MAEKEILCLNIPKAENSITDGFVFNYPTHTHSYYEMTLYEPFDGGVTVNGEFFDVKVPSVFMVSPSDFHRITVFEKNPRSRFIKIGFYENTLDGFRGELPNSPLTLDGLENHRVLTELFEEIFRHGDDASYSSTLISSALFYLVKHGKTISPAIQGKKHELAIKVLRFVNKEFTEDISLEKTAEAFSVSPQHLSSVFSAEVGMGFSAYLSELRLKRAAELLEKNDQNVSEVCFACGYKNVSHFLRSFKNRFKMTPKQYRNKN